MPSNDKIRAAANEQIVCTQGPHSLISDGVLSELIDSAALLDNGAEIPASELWKPALAALLELQDRRKNDTDYTRDRRSLFMEFLEMRGVTEEDICRRCSGLGTCVYGSTATWRGGIGGQIMTRDVCNKCWGSGSASRPWLNLKTIDVAKCAEPGCEIKYKHNGPKYCHEHR